MHGRNVKFIADLGGDHYKFNKLIKKYLECKFENVEATITDGPYDGKRDIVVTKGDKILPLIVQTTTTDAKNIEAKFEEDLNSILSSKFSFNSIYYFCSSVLSNQKIFKLRDLVDLKSGGMFSFHLYDANTLIQELEQDRYASVYNFLMTEIYKIPSSKKLSLDQTEQIFYEFILISKESTDLKNALLNAQILNCLNEENLSLDELHEKLNIPTTAIQGRINNLIKENKVIRQNNNFCLTVSEKNKIAASILKLSSHRASTITSISEILNEYNVKNISEDILDIFETAYSHSLDIQLTEREFRSPQNSINRDIKEKVSKLIIDNKINTPAINIEFNLERIIEKIISTISKNEYLSYSCSAKLSFNLISNYKYNAYKENKKFFIYLDAPVFIPYLIAWRMKDKNLYDKSLYNVSKMFNILDNIKEKELRISSDHYEETVRHLEQAYRLSLFVDTVLLNELGQSKNVFFNVYVKWKAQNEDGSFLNYLSKLISFDSNKDINQNTAFRDFDKYLYDLLTATNKIRIITPQIFSHINEDFIKKIQLKLSTIDKRDRKKRAVENDIRTAGILSTDDFHLNTEGVTSTPILITLDGSQYQLREAVRECHKNAQWYIFTPQRAIERLSLMSFKISPEIVEDGLMAIFYENYFFNDKEVSLLDTLSMIINPTQDSDFVDSIVRIKRKLFDESLHTSEIDIEKYNFLSEVLAYTYYEYKNNFEEIKILFNNKTLKTDLEEILLNIIQSDIHFSEELKISYKNSLNILLERQSKLNTHS